MTLPAPEMLADELVAWVEGYAKKICPEGCLPTRGQEREINLFARITVALKSPVDAKASREALEEIAQLTNVGRGDIISLQDAFHEIHGLAVRALTVREKP